jgi:RNA polymerase sigma-70 factor (ECF subfamily)
MSYRPDGSALLATGLSMSCVSHEEVTAEAAEVVGFIRLTLAGDASAFEPIVLRYESRVMTLALRLLGRRDEARDAAQEVFLRAFKYLHRLDLQKPVQPWLMRITVNVCHDAARRRQKVHDTFVQGEPTESIDEAGDPFTGLVAKEERVILRKALDSLPERERLAIVLRDVEGLSTTEVASILGSSETTVRSQVSRGRLRLKTAIDRLMGGTP